jgi:hypothetical protein
MALDTIPSTEGGKFKAIASGTLPSGKPVVVNSDGTVSVVAETSVSDQTTTPSFFTNNNIASYLDVAYDEANQKAVIVYADEGNSSYATAVVATVDPLDNSLTFGTPVVFDSVNADDIAVAYDSNAQKIVVVYYGFSSPNTGLANVGTVSGTSISFGGRTTMNDTGPTKEIGIVYVPDQQKIVASYRDQNNSNYGVAIVGTVSGSSISFGTEVIYNSGNTISQRTAYDTTKNRIIFGFRNPADDYLDIIIGTVSGTSITVGSIQDATTVYANPKAIVHDSVNNKNVVIYSKSPEAGFAKVFDIDVSDNSCSFGSEAQWETGSTGSSGDASFNAAAGKIDIVYKDEGDASRGKLITGTVSGSSITFNTATTFESDPCDTFAITYNTTLKNNFAAYEDEGGVVGGKAFVNQIAFTESNLTAENFVGMSGGAIEVDSDTQVIGSPTVFESAGSVEIGSAYDANAQRVVVAYRDGGNSNYGTAVVGTVSGTSISFGTPVVFLSAVARYSSVVYDANAQKVVIAYRNDGNNESTAIVGTVSGTTISFGTAVVFGTAASNDFATTYDANAQKVVIAYMTTDDNGIAIVGTVSGTSISFGTPTQLENSRNSELAIAYDANAQKVVVAYTDLDNSNYGTTVVGTVSGTSISFGTPVVFNAGDTSGNSIAYDANAQKVVIAYTDGGNSNYGTAIVGTVSGTSISFGSEVVFDSTGSVSYSSAVYDANAKRIVIFYRAGSVGNVIVGTVSGTSISFATSAQFESGAANHNSSIYDPDTQKVVVAYEDGGNSGYGTSLVFQTGYTNIIRGSVADGDNATVDIVGTVSSNQVGLTAGQQYYVQTDGTLSETPADPSVLAGTAISATRIVVKS